MEYQLSELLALEKAGHYQEALKRIQAERCEIIALSPVRRLNLQLLEQRIHTRLKRGGVAFRHSGESMPITTSKRTWSAIITMWKRKDYFEEQLKALRGQSLPPLEIIVILNEDHISEKLIKKNGDLNIKIIRSDINSLYTRWAMAYNAEGDYIAVFDDDVIPGKDWVSNAIRACSRYNALVGPRGRIYNTRGKKNFFKLVSPDVKAGDETMISCAETDVFCDWVCNSYLFKREWIGHILGQVRYRDSYKTFDDIQLATSLFLNGGIRCVVPMQPVFDKYLHGSLKPQYGSDTHAIWRANSEQHFTERKLYVEQLKYQGYVPVQHRNNLFQFHIVVPFGERECLERCLLSVKGQTYNNYTCTIIDDCHDGRDTLELINRLCLDKIRFRYIKTKKKSYPLRSREIATDMLGANSADVIVHLDGDDWLANPDVLSRLNRIYRKSGIFSTYGNAVCLRSFEHRDFQEFTHFDMSMKWNVAQNDPNAKVFPFRRLTESEVSTGWGEAPWCAMHVRSFQFITWVGMNRKTFLDDQGNYLRVGTDAAILIPILDACPSNSVEFVPDAGYIYQNANNTIHAKKEISIQQKNKSLAVIANAEKTLDQQAVRQFLMDQTVSPPLLDADVLLDTFYADVACREKCVREGTNLAKQNKSKDKNGISSIVTIVTPDYLGDALLCLLSYQRNLREQCRVTIFVATNDVEEMAIITRMFESSCVEVLFPTSLSYMADCACTLEEKYTLVSDEYRWAMKGVLLMELLRRGSTLALFLDPDMYTVSDITDVHHRMMRHPISVFPHFRDPDHEYLRGLLYRDGFFNGGMIAATQDGMPYLMRLYERCLQEMKKDPTRNRWDDQKYFDLFTLEVAHLYVNQDRGINYNAWNYEPVEGLVAPSQRSLLLKSGYFVRIWHLSTAMIQNSITLKEKKFSVYRPAIAMYMVSLLYVLVLLRERVRGECVSQDGDFLRLMNRYNAIEEKLIALSVDIPVGEVRDLLETVQMSPPEDINTFLEKWTNSLLGSICFDNFEIFAIILKEVFAKQAISANMQAEIRRHDLRYIADEVVGGAELYRTERMMLQEKEGAGTLIKKQLGALKSCNIKY